MSSFFFGTLTFFGALLFLAQCLARKKYEFRFFGTHTFISTMFGPNKYDVSLGTHPFFLEPIFSFWHNVWPEKV